MTSLGTARVTANSEVSFPSLINAISRLVGSKKGMNNKLTFEPFVPKDRALPKAVHVLQS